VSSPQIYIEERRESSTGITISLSELMLLKGLTKNHIQKTGPKMKLRRLH